MRELGARVLPVRDDRARRQALRRLGDAREARARDLRVEGLQVRAPEDVGEPVPQALDLRALRRRRAVARDGAPRDAGDRDAQAPDLVVLVAPLPLHKVLPVHPQLLAEHRRRRQHRRRLRRRSLRRLRRRRRRHGVVEEEGLVRPRDVDRHGEQRALLAAEELEAPLRVRGDEERGAKVPERQRRRRAQQAREAQAHVAEPRRLAEELHHRRAAAADPAHQRDRRALRERASREPRQRAEAPRRAPGALQPPHRRHGAPRAELERRRDARELGRVAPCASCGVVVVSLHLLLSLVFIHHTKRLAQKKGAPALRPRRLRRAAEGGGAAAPSKSARPQRPAAG